MDVTINDSGTRTRGTLVYTGLNDFRIVALNPDLELLKELTGNPETKESRVQYSKPIEDSPEDTRTRLDFYLSGNGIKAKSLSFWMDTRERKNNAGTKFEFIDARGNHTWAEDKKSLDKDRIDTKTARKALNGESSVIDFLASFFNINTRNPEASLNFKDPKKIAEGDVGEIKEALKRAKNNKVKLLALGRKVTSENGSVNVFQDFYPHYSCPPYVKDVNRLNKLLTNEYSALKEDQVLEDGYEWSEYTGQNEKAITAGPAAEAGGYDDGDLNIESHF